MYYEKFSVAAATGYKPAADKLEEYIQNGLIDVFDRIEIESSTENPNNGVMTIYNSDKPLVKFRSSDSNSFSWVYLYRSPTEYWSFGGASSSLASSARWIYGAYICKYGVILELTSSNAAIVSKGYRMYMIFSKAKNGEIAISCRNTGSTTGTTPKWKNFITVAYGDVEAPLNEMDLSITKYNKNYTTFIPLPTNKGTSEINTTVGFYWMPFSQLEGFDGIATLNGIDYYTDGYFLLQDSDPEE
jgi:hypothetical protein